MHRTFAFQSFTTFDASLWNAVLQQAQHSIFSHPYQLIGYDYDKQVLSYAKENAERAGLAGVISRKHQKFLSSPLPFSEGFWLLTNPPYGKRLASDEDLQPLYQQLAALLKGCYGGVISSYPEMDTLFPVSQFSHKSLYNGADPVELYWKKM
jgi:23S rRNA G2445 N2-methylase RlmL